MKLAAQMSRDRCRSPLQWSSAPNAGFSPEGVTPWLPVNANYAEGISVAEQERDPDSLLHFYRRLLQMRRNTPALVAGDYADVSNAAEDYLAYTRTCEGQACLMALNLTSRPQTAQCSVTQRQARCLFSTTRREGKVEDLPALSLAPFEVYIGELMD